MKLLGIGDLLIKPEYIERGFKEYGEIPFKIDTTQWDLDNFDELQNINQKIEQNGSNYYDVPEKILEAAKNADIVITQFCPINKNFIKKCEKLKIIGVLRGGYENIDVDYANKNDILVYHTPGRNSEAVADFTIGMILSECRNIARSHRELKKGNWKRNYANEKYVPDMSGKTVGIIGLGEIGQKVAKRLKGFDVKILAYDPYVEDIKYDIKKVELEELMSESDFVTLHARVTKETKNIINKEMIELMKDTSYIINTARPDLIDENALYKALKNKEIFGAALDVFKKEPPGEKYPLVKLDNVTITPHLAGGTTDAFLNSPKRLAKEMLKLWEGKSSRFLLNEDKFSLIAKDLK